MSSVSSDAPQHPYLLSIRLVVTVHDTVEQHMGAKQQQGQHGQVVPSQMSSSPGTITCPSARCLAGCTLTPSTTGVAGTGSGPPMVDISPCGGGPRPGATWQRKGAELLWRLPNRK